MGFSQADWQELQINLDRIRWGSRVVPRPPIRIPGLPDLGQKPTRSKKEKKSPEDPGYQKYQLRLW